MSPEELDERIDSFTEQHMIGLIKDLQLTRQTEATFRRRNEAITTKLKNYLHFHSEPRELWDHEVDPPIGVRLKDGGAKRWIDWLALTDEDIVYAARNGCLALAATDYEAAVAHARATGDLDAIEELGAIGQAIHEGGGESLVMLGIPG